MVSQLHERNGVLPDPAGDGPRGPAPHAPLEGKTTPLVSHAGKEGVRRTLPTPPLPSPLGLWLASVGWKPCRKARGRSDEQRRKEGQGGRVPTSHNPARNAAQQHQEAVLCAVWVQD